MRRFLAVLLLPLLIAAVPDKVPAPIGLTPAELELVHQRQIATRFDEGSGSSGGVVGVLDVAASVDATWKALLDLEARVGEIGGLASVTRYLNDGTRIGARWEAKFLGASVVFHIVYELHPSERFVRFHLDGGQENDVAAVQGAYQVYEVDGKTRLVYWSETDTGKPVPQWVKRWLATDALGEQLSGIRGRAEAGR